MPANVIPNLPKISIQGARYHGDSITELDSDWSWSQDAGYTRTRIFDGEVNQLRQLAENTKLKKDADDANEKWFVQYQLSTPNPDGYARLQMLYQIALQEIWYLNNNDIAQSLWLQKDVVTFKTSLTNINFGYMLEAFQGGVAGQKTFAQIKTAYPNYNANVYTPSSSTQKTLQENLYLSLAQGQDAFYMPETVLRRRITIPGITSVALLETTMAYVGMVFTKAAMLAQWPTLGTAPHSAVFALIPNTKKALYKSPNITVTASGQLEIDQEWLWQESWTGWVYTFVLT